MTKKWNVDLEKAYLDFASCGFANYGKQCIHFGDYPYTN
jgi:hypothetical protein